MALTAQSAHRKDTNNPRDTTLEHRHFAFIANVIADWPEGETRDQIATTFADACRHTNPRFDRRRFLLACGVQP